VSMKSEMKEISLDSLQPFKEHFGRAYEGERLKPSPTKHK